MYHNKSLGNNHAKPPNATQNTRDLSNTSLPTNYLSRSPDPVYSLRITTTTTTTTSPLLDTTGVKHLLSWRPAIPTEC